MKNKSIAWFILLVLVCLGFFSVQVGTRRMGPWVELMDIWEHAAAVAEIAANPASPQNPLLDLPGSTSPRFTPYIVALGILSRVLHISAYSMLYGAGFLNLAIFCCALYAFIHRCVTGSTAPAITWLFMLSLWGEGWRYSSEYCLVTFISNLAYPSSVAFSLSILSLFLLLKDISRGDRKSAAGYLLLSVIVFTTHTLTWLFLALTSAIVLCTSKSKRRGWYLLLISLCVSLLSGIVWPYYDLLHLIQQSLSGPSWYETTGYLYTSIIRKAGPSLFLLPIPFLFLLKRQFIFPALSFFACLVVYVISYCCGIVLLDRYIYCALFFLHVCGGIFVAGSLQKKQKLNRIPASAILAIAVLCFCYQGTKLCLELSGRYIDYGTLFTIKRYEDPVEKLLPLRNRMAARSVVISDTLTSWTLPALFNVKVVSLLHNNPLVADNAKRCRDVELFFRKETGLLKRQEIVRGYGVSYILLNKSPRPWDGAPRTPEGIAGELKQLGRCMYEDENLVLIRIS